jgi:hypothetical protein
MNRPFGPLSGACASLIPMRLPGCAILIALGVGHSVGQISAKTDVPQAPTTQASSAPVLATYRNDTADFTLSYPSSLKMDDAKSLREAIECGHRVSFGTDPQTDPEHQRAEKCTHVLLSATLPEKDAPTVQMTDTNHSPPIETNVLAEASIFVAEMDRSCLPSGATDDQILSSIAATPTQLPGFKAINPQMWYDVDDHKIHLGSASGARPKDPGNGKVSADSEQVAVAVASFVEKKHLLMVMLTANNPATMHLLMQSLIQFGKHEPAALMPFAIGNGMPINLVR